MTQAELRDLHSKYCLDASIEDHREILRMFSKFFLLAIKNHHTEKSQSDAEIQAKLVFQMMFSKTLHLIQASEGVSFDTMGGLLLNKITDPTILAISIRNIFETAGMFHTIYCHPKSEEESKILYRLWVIAGLSYRQRFEVNITSAENRSKFEYEKAEIERLSKEIEQTNLYKNLDTRNQEKIKSRIKEKEYLLKFENNKVCFLHWHDLINLMGIKPGFLDNIYTYFSLYSHPSNVSVFQFGSMFDAEKKAFEDLSNFNLQYAIFLLSIFIADYIKIFPTVKTTFESLSLIEQIILDYSNIFLRGYSFSINHSYRALG